VLRSAGLCRFTPRTITSLDEPMPTSKKAARDGYACSVKELEEGLKAIAAPVRDHTGAVVAALSVSGPPTDLTGS
jgi:DNA-binding IclR family transcriptional regulator